MARALLRFIDRSFGRFLLRAITAFDRMHVAMRPGRRGDLPAQAGRGPRNILVIKLVGLGDTVLMLTPLARLREELPDARITALVTPLSSGILESQPYVDGTIVYDVFGKGGGIPGVLRTVRSLRSRKFDCIIDFEQHFHLTSILALLTGAPRRLGFYFDGSPRRGAFTDPVRIDPDQHMVDSYMDLISPLGVASEPVERLERIRISGEDSKAAVAWLRQRGISADDVLVGMHTGSGPRAPAKRWGPDNYAEIIRRLRSECGAAVVLTGSCSERKTVEGIVNRAGPEGVYNAAGEFSIIQTAALLVECSLFISNDTGPMHIAAATGIPTIGIFGPETPVRYGPVGKANTAVYAHIDCSPCVHIYAGVVNDCAMGHCIRAVGVDDVWQAILKYDLGGHVK